MCSHVLAIKKRVIALPASEYQHKACCTHGTNSQPGSTRDMTGNATPQEVHNQDHKSEPAQSVKQLDQQ